MLDGKRQEPVADLTEEGEILQVHEGGVHDIRSLHLQLRELLHLLLQVAVLRQLLPFRVHLLIQQLLRRDLSQIDLLANLRADPHHLGQDLVLHLPGDLFRLTGQDKADRHAADRLGQPRETLSERRQTVPDPGIKLDPFTIYI